MNYDLLLTWMGHVGEGSWMAFRRTVAYLAEADSNGEGNPDELARRARPRLADLGHADFFLEGGASWRVFAPVLGGLPEGGVAVLCGARTAALVEALERASAAAGCELTAEDSIGAPRRIAVMGEDEALSSAAEAAGIRFVHDLPGQLAASLVPIQEMIDTAERAEPPINWSDLGFDFEGLTWSDRVRTPTAHEYRSKYGARQHLVDVPGRGLVAMDRRAAVYAAALTRSVDLTVYDASSQQLSVPLAAPLPAPYARTATLCSGRLSTVLDGRACYANVPPRIAAVLTIISGSGYPMSPTLYQGAGRSR